jgi:hypothetical protein
MAAGIVPNGDVQDKQELRELGFSGFPPLVNFGDAIRAAESFSNQIASRRMSAASTGKPSRL